MFGQAVNPRNLAINLVAAVIVAAWLVGVAMFWRDDLPEPDVEHDPFLDQYLDGMNAPAARTYRAWGRAS